MTCKYCGKENSSDAKFCQGCGKELTNQEDSLQKENGYPIMKEAVSGQEYDVRSDQQRKKFMRICAVLIICVVGGFVLNKFGIFRFLPVEISDCLGMEMDDFQSKYFMSRYDEDSLSDGNVLVKADDDGKITSVYSDCKGVFRVYGIVCGMSKERVMEKMPDYYSYHSSKDGLAYYISYDTDRILAFDFDNDGVLKKLSYFDNNTSSSGGIGKIKQQSSANKELLSKLPIEVSIFLEKEMAEVKEQYQLEMDKVFGMALEKDNVSMLDSDEDGRIDRISLSASEGNYTLFKMRCGESFNMGRIPSEYTFYDSTDVAANLTNAYTRYIYISKDKQKILDIDCWKDERIKSIELSHARGQIDLEESSSDENQEDDLVYGLYSEDNDYYDYGEDDSDYDDSDDYDYDDYDSDDYDYDDYEDEYILPYSDTAKLKKSDLRGLSKTELRLARNEIYARHGRRFQDSSLQEYFDSQDWYYGYIEPEDFVDSEQLSALERRNAKFIRKFE